MNRLFRFAVCTFACTGATVAAEQEAILLDPSAPRPTALEVPLFGYKRFPEEIFTIQKSDKYGLPTEVIYASASKIPAIKAAAAASGKSIFDLEAREVVALARSKQHALASDQQSPSSATTLVPWVGTEVDAEFITDLVSSELVGRTIDIFGGEMTGDEVEMVSIDEEVVRDFWNAYSNLDNFDRYDPFQRLDQFQQVQTTLDKYPLLLQAAKINFSPVSFGEIFVFSSLDRSLEIPSPIARKYDVYWVEFPMSLRDLEEDQVTEVSFHVFLSEDSRALDLIPWRVGTDKTVTEETKSPSITVKEIAIGEFYKRTVAYTTLRPTIVATGLREHKFSWVLTGEAVSTGSYLFVGVVGVPKGSCSVTAGLGVNAKTADVFGFQGDVAGTGVIVMEIALPCEKA